MTIRIALQHRTEYHFDRSVNLSPHVIRLRPAPHTRTPVHQYSLKIEPAQHFINWMQDPFGNYTARLVFPEKTRKMVIDVNLVADLVTVNPFDFFVEEYAEYFPFQYEDQVKKELAPYFEIREQGDLLKGLLEELKNSSLGIAATEAMDAAAIEGADDKPDHEGKSHIVHFLVALNQALYERIGYTIRMEPGVQTCEQTLQRETGSCRDTGWLLVQIMRHFGLAARFVSGYLVQLTADQKSLDGPSGPEQDFTDLHAWAEVFIPGAGWIGLDPTSGLFAGEGHIPLACTPDPVSAAPIVGATDKCEVEFKFKNEVVRVHEDPRVTLPYSEDQWNAIEQLGHYVDDKLREGDVRLTMGGEPTFVSIDDMDGAQWNTSALGEYKLRLAQDLLLRLKDQFGFNGALHYGQGKWYPGEQLPRWALGYLWLKDGSSIWSNAHYLDQPRSDSQFDDEQARGLMQRIASHVGLKKGFIREAYEDVPYYLWKEGTLPKNVTVDNNKIKDVMERERIRKVFDQGLNKVIGFVLPLAWNEKDRQWQSSDWQFRREHLYLIPGDSAMGYRLPLDSLLWEPTKKRQQVIEKDPFDEFGHLPQLRDRVFRVTKEIEPESAYNSEHGAIRDQHVEQDPDQGLIRTALCVEQRDGRLHVFMPPLSDLEHYLDLVNAIEASAVENNTPVIMEGYEAPFDPRLSRILVTPDPGVIEVNIHPSESWDELVLNTHVLYEQARLSRLGTEKFMLDGRHTGTGGGNHITIGAAKPKDSPILRRPHLLKSLLTYWQNHPSLSYLFSGLFMGPTSQSPRVDEARDDNLYELGIALSEMSQQESSEPWKVDRLLRNLLVDLTGNTHRAEFCIDKLYSPSGASGRLGIVEFRGFEMPPHAQMSLMQAALLRSLIARFWDKPYEQPLVPWGTSLHDRFLLPHFVGRDMQDVVKDLNQHGFAFDYNWLAPFMEFRFPRYGVINIDDIEMELRFAIEPWHVLGEEMSSTGTARYVDSSVERLQVKVNGMTDRRHVITCNGRRVPLRSTGVGGEYVAGVRYKAWQPPSGLHPTIAAQVPLVFDVIDAWNERSLGGCQYHVAHPGGRSYDTFPINANEAESRRLSRFLKQGHSGGQITIPDESINAEFPLTLDLRRRTRNGERP